MSQNDCIGKTLKPWPILVDHYIPQNQNMTDKYKQDWESMADMFPKAELPYSFEDLIANVKSIEAKANDSFYADLP